LSKDSFKPKKNADEAKGPSSEEAANGEANKNMDNGSTETNGKHGSREKNQPIAKDPLVANQLKDDALTNGQVEKGPLASGEQEDLHARDQSGPEESAAIPSSPKAAPNSEQAHQCHGNSYPDEECNEVESQESEDVDDEERVRRQREYLRRASTLSEPLPDVLEDTDDEDWEWEEGTKECVSSTVIVKAR